MRNEERLTNVITALQDMAHLVGDIAPEPILLESGENVLAGLGMTAHC